VSQSPAETIQKNIAGAVDTKKLCVIFSLGVVSKVFVLFETKNCSKQGLMKNKLFLNRPVDSKKESVTILDSQWDKRTVLKP
jgi:hypothetical protein